MNSKVWTKDQQIEIDEMKSDIKDLKTNVKELKTEFKEFKDEVNNNFDILFKHLGIKK